MRLVWLRFQLETKIGCLAYSPLASGYLTGKYRNGNLPKGSRIERDLIFGQDIKTKC